MKLKAVKRYVDKYTKEIVEPDTELNDVPKERAEELVKEGVAEIVDEKAATKKSIEKQEG